MTSAHDELYAECSKHNSSILFKSAEHGEKSRKAFQKVYQAKKNAKKLSEKNWPEFIAAEWSVYIHNTESKADLTTVIPPTGVCVDPEDIFDVVKPAYFTKESPASKSLYDQFEKLQPTINEKLTGMQSYLKEHKDMGGCVGDIAAYEPEIDARRRKEETGGHRMLDCRCAAQP